MKKNISWHDASEIMSESKECPMWICRTHFKYNGLKFSVVNGFGTYDGWYGANPGMTEDKNMGLLEIMIEDNEPVGWLKAEDIIKS